jgi:hypothetical protein
MDSSTVTSNTLALIALSGVVLFAAALGWIVFNADKKSKEEESFLKENFDMDDEYKDDAGDADLQAAYFDMKEKHCRDCLGIAPNDDAAALAAAEQYDEKQLGALLRTKLSKEPKASLKAALLRWGIQCIGKTYRIQMDKPGAWRLLDRKLVSDKWYHSLLETERDLGIAFETIKKEAEMIEPGWGEVVIPQAMHYWRIAKSKEAVDDPYSNESNNGSGASNGKPGKPPAKAGKQNQQKSGSDADKEQKSLEELEKEAAQAAEELMKMAEKESKAKQPVKRKSK